LAALDARLTPGLLTRDTAAAARDLASLGDRLRLTGLRTLQDAEARIARTGPLLESLSPFRVLERGYAVVEDRAGHPLGAAAIEPGMALSLRFADATVAARAESGAKPLGAPPEKPKPKQAKPGERQPSLF
jgi:exodeoxyribonuclease VII large subunit